MALIESHTIGDLARQALERHGASPAVAKHVANAVEIAECNGNRICGLYYLESYCVLMTTSRVDGAATPEVTLPKPGSVLVDARNGFAQPAFAAALDQAVEIAQTNGVCSLAIAHSHTATALGYFTDQLADRGMIALGMTNATPRVAPPGGSQPVLGTNPIAFSVPAADGGRAFGFDFSTSAVALGTITMAAAAGDSIDPSWAVDSDGNPTHDPNAALKGSLQSAGGYKGWGIGLMVEVLAAALTGTNLSTQVPPLKAAEGPPHDLGQFYLIIDPTTFAGQTFHDRVAALAESVDVQPGARLPGSKRAPVTEIDVPDQLWEQLQTLAGT